MTNRNALLLLTAGCFLAQSAGAQDLISAQSGLIHYTEGDVFVGATPIKKKPGEYPNVKAGQHLRTAEGRAEILLTPGVFLRLAENSEVVMKSTALTDTRIEVLEGSIILEAAEIQKEHSIELAVAGSVLSVKKRTTFRLDVGTPPRVRVYDGEVAVVEPGRPVNVKEGKQLAFTSVPVVEKFDKEETDTFYRWAGRRSGYLALANASAARRVYDENIPWQVGGWYFNPFFGMFTYIPQRGRYTNAWNHFYHSPAPAYRAPMPIENSGIYSAGRGSFDTGGRGASAGVYQAPAVSSGGGSAPASSAPAPARSGDSGASRGGGGGHR